MKIPYMFTGKQALAIGFGAVLAAAAVKIFAGLAFFLLIGLGLLAFVYALVQKWAPSLFDIDTDLAALRKVMDLGTYQQIRDALNYAGDGKAVQPVVINTSVKIEDPGTLADYLGKISEDGPAFVFKSPQVGVAGEELKKGDVVAYDLNAGPDQKIYKTDTVHQADPKTLTTPVTWGDKPGLQPDIKATDFKLISHVGPGAPATVFTYTDGKLAWASQAAKDSYLSFNSPEYAIALAKYDQARRNGKKSSGFLAEMKAIQDQFLAETAKGVAQ